MLLDRIDIDAHGPLHRVELGPFSEHLNVVCGPHGSGKTAIVRFIRDSLVRRQYPLGMMSSSTGTVVWADRDGMVHCRREQDGTAEGRTVVDFHPRGDHLVDYGPLRQSWISDITHSTQSDRTLRAIEMPESLVDGVITDTAISNVARVVAACLTNGLDAVETYQSLPLGEEVVVQDRESIHWQASGLPVVGGDLRRSLRSQLADVEAELARLDAMSLNYQSLIERRSELTSRLADIDDRGHVIRTGNWSSHANDQQRLADLCEDARKLRLRQGDLRREIADLDRSRLAESYPRSAYRGSSRRFDRHHRRSLILDSSVQRQVDDLDAQIIGWRRTLLEVRGLREALGDHRSTLDPPTSAWDDPAIRRQRLDGFLHSVDRYERTWDSRRPHRRRDHIRERIDSATRQIDWLLTRYASGDSVNRAWYDSLPASASYRATTTLGDTLRAIRDDLNHVYQNAPVASPQTPYRSEFDRSDELRQCEHWLSTAIHQLTSHRDTLLRGIGLDSKYRYGVDADPHAAYPYVTHPDHARVLDHARLRAERVAELDEVTSELDTCLAEAAAIRRSLRSGVQRDHHDRSSVHWTDREALRAELNRIDEQLASYSRMQWLRERRRALMAQLGTVRHPATTHSPLSEAASRWLVRLTGGRLRRIHWHPDRLANQSGDVAGQFGVSIDGNDEGACSEVDRALAVMAVRMAAGDLLASTGRQVPLVFETHRQFAVDPSFTATGRWGTTHPPFHQTGSDGRANHPLLAALRDYTRGGRQAIVLTSDQAFSLQAQRVGARVFQIHAQHVVHPHRPLWRPHYQGERYVGPHPHTYGRVDAADFEPAGLASHPRPVVDINRDFDMAWREAYGYFDTPDQPATANAMPSVPARTDWKLPGADYRDGYYYSDSYTTVRPQAPSQFDAAGNWVAGQVETETSKETNRPSHSSRQATTPESPFFLTVDSPIDQAPSIDAVAAARLRGLGVTHITHLMQHDSNRLSDALGLANVNAATIRRWKAECRLVCRVPQLRGFDARVLVGCGVTDPGQLAAIHPVDLLQEVEAFLATERGQQILASGSSHELSRITSWIAAANSSPEERAAATARNQVSGFGHTSGDASRYDFDDERYQRASAQRRTARRRQGTRRDQNARQVRASDGLGPVTTRSRSRRRRTSETAINGTGSARRTNRNLRSSERQTTRRRRRAEGTRSSNRDLLQYSRDSSRRGRATRRRQREETAGGESMEPSTMQELRFYLQRNSPIVDAPSIGSRMSERLNGVGIETVNDLLVADADSLAAELASRRVTADVIVQWQQQAELVCRVPMLRGHDAQLLVMAEVTTPEELSTGDPEELFALIDPISRSKEGQRVLRGGKLPDLEEVTQWVDFAQHTRELIAA